MQTFLPYPDFRNSARCLDNKRLGKQRVECLQILNILVGDNQEARWKNHPAVQMWSHNPAGLAAYGIRICSEWRDRGYRDSCFEKICNLIIPSSEDLPVWFGLEAFHASHRSNLLRKDPAWYGHFGWKEGPDLDYVWPSREIV